MHLIKMIRLSIVECALGRRTDWDGVPKNECSILNDSFIIKTIALPYVTCAQVRGM